MRKLLVALMLCMVSIGGFGQISTSIKPQQKTYKIEYIGQYTRLYVDWTTSDTIYSMYVKSTNEFEHKSPWIKLGNRIETIESLNILLTLFVEDTTVDIQGYRLYCHKNYLSVGGSKLTYTAGSYWIYKTDIKKALKILQND